MLVISCAIFETNHEKHHRVAGCQDNLVLEEARDTRGSVGSGQELRLGAGRRGNA